MRAREARRARALLGELEAQREEIEAEIERLRHVCSTWDLTAWAMERDGVRASEARRWTGVGDLRVYRDPISLRERPEDYSKTSLDPPAQKRMTMPEGKRQSS